MGLRGSPRYGQESQLKASIRGRGARDTGASLRGRPEWSVFWPQHPLASQSTRLDDLTGQEDPLGSGDSLPCFALGRGT